MPAALIKISVGVCIIEEPPGRKPLLPCAVPQTLVTQHASPLFSHSTQLTHANSSLSFDTAVSCLIPSQEKQTQNPKRFTTVSPSVKHSIENALIDESPHEITITEVPQQGTSPTLSDLHSCKLCNFRLTQFVKSKKKLKY